MNCNLPQLNEDTPFLPKYSIFFWGGGGGGGEGTEGLMKRITLNTEKVEGLDKWLTERNLI